VRCGLPGGLLAGCRRQAGKPGRKAKQEGKAGSQAGSRIACLPGVKAAREGSAAGGFLPKAALNRLLEPLLEPAWNQLEPSFGSRLTHCVQKA